MSFKTLPKLRGNAAPREGVNASVRKKGGKKATGFQVNITLYADAMQAFGAAVGDKVRVEYGGGEDLGLIRLHKLDAPDPDGFVIGRYTQAKIKGSIGCLRLQLFNEIEEKTQSARGCEFRRSGDALQIKLPPWSRLPSLSKGRGGN